jgi:ribosome-binding protein aMBF1 (putative translation factor)
MPNRCKECGKRVPSQGKSVESFACQKLNLCRYCYRVKFGEPPRRRLPALRQGSQRLLSYGQRRRLIRRQFEGMEALIWEPEFYQEWLDSLEE